MQKKKWWLVLAIIIIAIVALVIFYEEEHSTTQKLGLKLRGVGVEHTDNTNLAHINWIKEYPQLAKVESNNQTAVIDKLRVSESISELIGPINNPYGVRDDILDEIVKMVPESNPQMLEAAVKDAYYYNLANYAISDDDKRKYMSMDAIATHCEFYFDHNASGLYAISLSEMINKKTTDTHERAEYIHHIDSTVFAWRLLGETGSETDKQCAKVDY